MNCQLISFHSRRFDPYRLLGCNAIWFICWFRRYTNRLLTYLLPSL